MQPSSDQPGSGGGNALRRYGPIVGIIAVIAIVVAIVAIGGDDDETVTDQTTAPSDTGTVERPEGAISWSQAEEEGLDVTFPDTCDTETGRVAIPYFYADECYADVDDNGGATSTGVTEDSITVVYYSAPENDPILDFINGPIANDEVAARADAQRAIEEHRPFAAFSGPVLTNAWADEMAAAGVVCIQCGLTGSERYRAERAPYLPAITMAGEQQNVHASEYIAKKLAGKPAEHAGDEALQGVDRVFGHLYLRSSEESDRNAGQFADVGVEFAEQLSYELDPGRLPEQATSVISKLKAAGVTTVVLQSDPVAPANFTQEATTQEYFPEWFVAGGTLVDTTAFGRVYDQAQWANAFGIRTISGADTDPALDPGFFLHEWYTGEPPPAAETAPVIYPFPALFFASVQRAGPDLTPETFRDGLFAQEPTGDAVTAASLSWGDHGLWDMLDYEADWSGIDDAIPWWWDADATGPDELQRDGSGILTFVDGGRSYLPGAWTDELRVFDPEGAVTIITDIPPDEQPPDYPSPAG